MATADAHATASRDMFAGLAPEAAVAGWLAAATPGTVKGLAESPSS